MDYTQVLGSVTDPAAGEFNLLVMLGVLALVIWTMVWKGLALWAAAKNTHKIWFIVMLVVNTLGILEIIYFFFFRKKEQVGQKIVEESFPAKEIDEAPKESL